MKVLLVHPGASWATADVEAGLRYGLQHHGVAVVPYRLDQRLEFANSWCHIMWRRKKRERPDLLKPNEADVSYYASIGTLEMALRHQVDAVVIVSAMFLHPDVLIMLRRANLRVTILFTESPYDLEDELRFAKLVDGCWTNERSCVPAFQQVCPRAGYVPHAWHPARHFVSPVIDPDVPRHDVVFVGSGFAERVAWLNAVDWTGIDLGLYGNWTGLGLAPALEARVRPGPIGNEQTARLYRHARIGLNLYRRSKGWGLGPQPEIDHAESLNPRAYELAACGVFHLSEPRAEVGEVFGDLVPIIETPDDVSRTVRTWLARPDSRESIARQLPARVAEKSWKERAMTIIGDLQGLVIAGRVLRPAKVGVS